MLFIGLDAGSVSVKVVVLDEKGNKLEGYYERHRGYPLSTACDLLEKVISHQPTVGRTEPPSSFILHPSDVSLSVTGSAGRLIGSVLGVSFTNELVAQTYATAKLFPHIKTIFELGGEDSKFIFLGEQGIKDFSMNSVCAAGTGSFLDQQAERMRLSIEEFSELALKAERPARIAGRCSVFAKSDMIHLQQIATPVEDIVAGLCFAVARNFKGSIVRGRAIEEPVSFHGGVAANKGMVRAFKEVFGFENLFVPEDHALIGALGAAFKDLDEGTVSKFDLAQLKKFIESWRFSETGHKPLIAEGDGFTERHNFKKQEAVTIIANAESGMRSEKAKPAISLQPSAFSLQPSEITEAYLGIDIGSISTNLAVIDETGQLLAKRYLMTASRPIDAVKQGLSEINEEIGHKIKIMGVATTGSGRYMIADYVGADVVKNEITAQATAAAFIDKSVDTIFEIGGQDSKYISMRNGVIVDFEMNKACAAGTGSFLEEQAEKLDVSVKEEFAAFACSADNPCRLGERCTVFMENSLMANLQKGADKEDLLAGLAYSIVQNYINKVVTGRPIGEHIFFQGGVAFNKSVVAAFEKYLGKKITIPPHHDVTGAIGMALIAMRHMKAQLIKGGNGNNGKQRATTFKGFELSKKPYEVSSFECKSCSNVCEINKVKIEGEDGFLFYGGRCEKYDVRKKKTASAGPDLFAFRNELLWEAHNKYIAGQQSANSTNSRGSSRSDGAAFSNHQQEALKRHSAIKNQNSKPTIGLPYIFFLHDYLPYWTTLMWELGFNVEVSPKTNREIIGIGIESVLADTCFPIKVANGHIKYLVEKGIDTLLIPSFINMNTEENEFPKGAACPLTQTIPYAARVSHPEVRVIMPIVDLQTGKKALTSEILKVFKKLGIKKDLILKAVRAAEEAQEEFLSAVKHKGEEVLSSIKEKTVVIVGRSYNASDSGMNLEIPRKLSDIGIMSIPMDFLQLEKYPISDRWPNMYWRSGQKILKAARAINANPNLYAIYIGNFSCGPDSFLLKFFAEEMKDKPYLHLEIDEHSADAGALTRCEAFLDSIDSQQPAAYPQAETIRQKTDISREITKRTIYIPRMADHTFALAAAFQKCGIPAEVMPESDKEAIDIGRRYVSGKECYPTTVTTGDMVKLLLSPGFKPEKAAFFMPSGSGPCRFGQYNVLHRMVLDELGFHDIPLYSPNQDDGFYKDLGIAGKDFSLVAWKGIVAYELLNKCLHETRPYEKEKGATELVQQRYIKKLYEALQGSNGSLETTLKEMRRDFESIPRHKVKKPMIGIVGEIFVRNSKFSNEDVIKKVEALGGEAWLSPMEEWIYYVNFTGLRNALIKKDKSAILEIFLKKFFQKRTEHKYSKYFEGFLKTINEPDIKEIIKKASPYLHDSFEGEAILSVGKSIDLIERGVSGIINAMPFGCMPGNIVTTLTRAISRDYGVSCISIAYDGSESPTTEIQLEAFMNQAKEHSKHKRRQ